MTPYTGSPATACNGYAESGATQNDLAFGLGNTSCTLGITFGGSFNGTIGGQTCNCELEGRTVFLHDSITLSSKGSTTGPALLTGLPFKVIGGDYGNGLACMGGDGSGAHKVAGLTGSIFAQPGPTTTNVNLYQQGTTDIAAYRPHALFYLDPPYLGSEHDYGRDLFPPADHAALAEALSRLKGGFILTVNDSPEARRIYGRFAAETARLSYPLPGSGAAKAARELILAGGGGGG